MEFSIRMVVVAIIVLVILIVAIALITGWAGTENDLVRGLFTFFENMLSGRTVPS